MMQRVKKTGNGSSSSSSSSISISNTNNNNVKQRAPPPRPHSTFPHLQQQHKMPYPYHMGPHGPIPPGALPPGALPPEALLQGALTPGALTPGAVPRGAVPPGAVPQGALPPGALPPRAFPPGVLPRGALPPGAVPRGALPPGAPPPGALPPRALPPGAMPPGALPRGALPPGPIPSGAVPRGAVPPGAFGYYGQVDPNFAFKAPHDKTPRYPAYPYPPHMMPPPHMLPKGMNPAGGGPPLNGLSTAQLQQLAGQLGSGIPPNLLGIGLPQGIPPGAIPPQMLAAHQAAAAQQAAAVQQAAAAQQAVAAQQAQQAQQSVAAQQAAAAQQAQAAISQAHRMQQAEIQQAQAQHLQGQITFQMPQHLNPTPPKPPSRQPVTSTPQSHIEQMQNLGLITPKPTARTPNVPEPLPSGVIPAVTHAVSNQVTQNLQLLMQANNGTPSPASVMMAHATAVNGQMNGQIGNLASGLPLNVCNNSCPWPLMNPVFNIPFFDIPSLKHVKLDQLPSIDQSGVDLPLSDIMTLRFFFNIGVQHMKNIMSTRTPNEQLLMQAVCNPVTHSQIINIIATLPGSVLNQALMPSSLEQQLQQAVSGHQLLRRAQEQQNMIALARAQAEVNTLAPGQNPFGDISRLANPASLGLPVTEPSQIQTNNLLNGQAVNGNGFNPAASTPSSQTNGTSAPTPVIDNRAEIQIIHPIAIHADKQPTGGPIAPTPIKSDGRYDAHAMLLQQALMNASHSGPKPSLHELRLQNIAVNTRDAIFSRPNDIVVRATPTSSNGGSTDSPKPAQSPIIGIAQPPICAGDVDAVVVESAKLSDVRKEAELAAAAAESVPTCSKASESRKISPYTSTIPGLIQMSENHFTDAFRRDEEKRRQEFTNPTSSSPKEQEAEQGEDKPALAPILMMSYLNTCMSQAKSTLNANGVQVGIDDNGQIIDFSSRPVDPIFKEARDELNRQRTFEGLRQSPKRVILKPESSPKPTSSLLKPIATIASSNPLGINRAISDAIPSISPKRKLESPKGEDDSDGDSVGGKRLRIATEDDSDKKYNDDDDDVNVDN